MKKKNAIGILTVLVIIGMVLMSGCTNTGSTSTAPEATPSSQTVNETLPVTPTLTPTISSNSTPAPEPVTNQTPAISPNSTPAPEPVTNQTPAISPNSTPAPEPVTSQTQSTKDPIIGSWLNGMVFYPNGTIGSDGTTVWKVNKNENNSYFVISDVLSPGANNPRNVTSAEWIYNPLSDKINMRGSSQTFARGIPTPVPTPIPTITTIQTPTAAVPTSTAPVATTAAVPEPLIVENGIGLLSIHTGGLGNDVSVFIAREGSNVPPINNIFDAYGNVVEGQTSGYIQVKILPDGNSEVVSLAPGNYIAYLPDKNGGQPEQQSFTINANCNTLVSFLGYSYRASSGGGCGG